MLTSPIAPSAGTLSQSLGSIVQIHTSNRTRVVGIGPTKTLAKLANHMAKKMPQLDGVCDLHAIPRAERVRMMAEIYVGEVWGVSAHVNWETQKKTR